MYQANVSNSKQETLFEMINTYFDSIRNIKLKANSTGIKELVQSSSKDILIIKTLKSFQEELNEMSNFNDPSYEIDEMTTSEYDIDYSDIDDPDTKAELLSLEELPLLKDNESIVLKFNLL